MMMTRRGLALAGLALAAPARAAAIAGGRPVRLMVPYPAGGVVDLVGRQACLEVILQLWQAQRAIDANLAVWEVDLSRAEERLQHVNEEPAGHALDQLVMLDEDAVVMGVEPSSPMDGRQDTWRRHLRHY